MAGAAVLAAAAVAGLSGRTFFAASHAKAAAPVKSGKTVLIRASGGQESLVVPLRPNRPPQGQLQMLDPKGNATGLCPLKHTDVTADIAGFVAQVSVTQTFHNPSKEAIEAVYTFPLPDDAAVDAMDMRIGNRLVKGTIQRREDARRIYNAAKNAGQSAALLDQERPNIFTQAVANVMPGQDVTITIRYVNTLKYNDGYYEFAFPMVVGPRFVPAGGYTEPGKRGEPSPSPAVDGDPGAASVVTDADKITPPITPEGTRAGHDIGVTVNLDAGFPIQQIASLSHDVDVTKTGLTRATVALHRGATIPNKDFILRYTVGGQQMQTGVIAHADAPGDGTFTLILQPPAAPPQSVISPKEMVFVLDQTGSQSGMPIAKAKETMAYAIEHMNPGDTFQLLGFTTDVNPCFPGPVAANAANVRKALDWIKPIEGNGGTDILKAADYVLKMPTDPKRLRIICFMTDGYVGNDMQIIDYVRKHRGDARMFPFGVGSSVNRFLVDGMAREGRGEAEFVSLDEDGRTAAERFYRRIASPVLLDPQVDWGGLPVMDVFPTAIPDVFSHGPIILKGRYLRAAEGDITVRGILRGQPWEQRVHVAFPAVRHEGTAIETLWARARIDDLQHQDWLGAQTGNPDANIKEQIVQTALDYNLMSQYTSFVAVEQRVVNVGGKQKTVDVPVEMPEGVSYDGIFGREAKQKSLASRSLYAPSQAAGGFAGGALAGAPMALGSPAPASAGTPALSGMYRVSPYADDASVRLDRKLELSDELKALTPEQRKGALEAIKLAPSLQGLAAKVKRDGKNGTLNAKGVPAVEKGQVIVQLWLENPPSDAVKKLEALGFKVSATLRPGKLLLGSLPVEKLDALLELEFVVYVEPPALH
jgi:Ca-activated chloride channel family protein